jgi:hypothetical protein
MFSRSSSTYLKVSRSVPSESLGADGGVVGVGFEERGGDG